MHRYLLHPGFAWYPVCANGRRVWLRWVETRIVGHVAPNGDLTEAWGNTGYDDNNNSPRGLSSGLRPHLQNEPQLRGRLIRRDDGNRFSSAVLTSRGERATLCGRSVLSLYRLAWHTGAIDASKLSGGGLSFSRES